MQVTVSVYSINKVDCVFTTVYYIGVKDIPGTLMSLFITSIEKNRY